MAVSVADAALIRDSPCRVRRGLEEAGAVHRAVVRGVVVALA